MDLSPQNKTERIKNYYTRPQAQACGFLFVPKIDLLTSTISFIKRMVANFVDVNKIALGIPLAPNSPQKFSKVILIYMKKKTKKPDFTGFLFG